MGCQWCSLDAIHMCISDSLVRALEQRAAAPLTDGSGEWDRPQLSTLQQVSVRLWQGTMQEFCVCLLLLSIFYVCFMKPTQQNANFLNSSPQIQTGYKRYAIYHAELIF